MSGRLTYLCIDTSGDQHINPGSGCLDMGIGYIRPSIHG